ncbi:hypothetical protein [Paraburkholderia heleia]|uniref:hypothetical protein n=1 Tax=Paraburkholderia heleia TaxID=634127 RepID=UPI0012ECE7F3|nr:hypothetical protein [Paraburkholderia heleia]
MHFVRTGNLQPPARARTVCIVAVLAFSSGCSEDDIPTGGVVEVHDYLPGYPRAASSGIPGGCLLTKIAQLRLSGDLTRTTARFVGVDNRMLEADPVSYFDVASGKRVATHRHRFATMAVGGAIFCSSNGHQT